VRVRWSTTHPHPPLRATGKDEGGGPKATIANVKVVHTGDLPRDGVVGPLFIGSVFRQTIVDPAESRSFNFSVINFSAGSRNKFHQHTSDQLLIVTEGTGVVATDTEQRTISAGDVVLIPAGENHWHGAPGATPMSHIAITAKDSKTQQTEA
jgi:quercetin dioxygenase-like cupin family protein